jgi:hypothetical protein
MRGFLACGFALFAVGLTIGACGGESDDPPVPLTRHFDEMYIAAIPVDQQKASFDAQHEWQISRAENAKAAADLDNAQTQLGIARNESKQAHLTVDSAIQAKKTAEKSGDMNKINQAQKDQHGAEDQEKATQARVSYLQAYVSYLTRYGIYTATNMYWHEAKFESTKAQIAKSNNIAPRGVQYQWFPDQLDSRQKRVGVEEHRAEVRKQNAVTARDQWQKIQHQADIENGKQTVAWDPLAPAVGTGGDQPAPAQSPAPAPQPQGSDSNATPQ